MVVVYGSDFLFGFEALDVLAAGLIVTMYDLVADGPHFVPSVPDACQDLRCPKLSGLLVGADALVGQIFVL
jgi:hypothetical protein